MKYQLKSSASLLALTAALGANTATAADMPIKSYQSAPPVVAESWTGPYIGASIGGAWDNLGETNTCPGGPFGSPCFGATSKAQSADLSSSNFLVGVQAGFNYQMGSWVAGVEGDVSGLPFNKHKIGPDATAGFIDAGLSGIASLRGRIGWVFDRTLVYATGGVGWLGMNYTQQGRVPGDAPISLNTTFVAPVVGGGFDYKVSRNFTVGIEGLAFLNARSKSLSSSSGRVYNVSPGDVGVVRAKASYNW